jgi:hypothetical protein
MPPAAPLTNHIRIRDHFGSLLHFSIKLFLTILLVIGELIYITVALDAQPLLQMTGLAHLLGVTAHWGLYTVILSFSLALALAWPRVRQVLRASPPDCSWHSFFPSAASFMFARQDYFIGLPLVSVKQRLSLATAGSRPLLSLLERVPFFQLS